ncbi:GDSL-type esterase/lipase family protein [Jeotgalibaca sp. A127]|uniref:GDSL-type esterase/lipase family protein n=1 Tax=Jeotgalibaca sp. A127 TaxID=3457324 RepID=UPI003FCEF2DA
MVFVGDSITQRNEWAEMFGNPKIVNRGIDSDRVGGVLTRLSQIVTGQPAKIFLLVGINDISDQTPLSEIATVYQEIVATIREKTPDTQLFLQSILPVNHSTYGHYIDNQVVVDLNTQIAQFADGHTIHYVALYDTFLADNKLEMAERFTHDGVHLSGEGYANWKKQLEGLIK